MVQLTKEQNALITLLRGALWGDTLPLDGGADWQKVEAIAREQGVASFLFEGAQAYPEVIPPEMLQKWKMQIFRCIAANERMMRAQDEILGWFVDAGIEAAVLKGTSVSRYYPHPDMRTLGDIDLLLRNEELNRAKEILEANGYVMGGADPGYHISLMRGGVDVELHYAVTAVPDSEGGKRMEAVTARFMENLTAAAVADHRFSVLSEPNQALGLLLHMIRHMVATGIGLRQMYDWAMFLAATEPVVVREDVLPMLAHCGILRYACAATRTCILYLGLPEQGLEWCMDVEDSLCEQIMENVFHKGNMGRADQESAGNLFSDGKSMGKAKSPLGTMLARLSRRAYHLYPFTEKWKILLPFFWVFLPVRYMVRSMLGLRPRKKVTTAIREAAKHRTLYDALHLFEINE